MKYITNGRIIETSVNASTLMNRTTVHGFARTMERAHRNDRKALRLIQNAWDRGSSPEQLKLRNQRDCISHYHSLMSDGYTELRIYAGFLFIFSMGGRLITMHALPERFFRRCNYDGKTMVRNLKKYHRFNRDGHYADDDLFSA